MGGIATRKVWTGLMIVPPVILLIALGPPQILYLMVCLAIALGLLEFFSLALPHSDRIERIVGLVLGLSFSIAVSGGDSKWISLSVASLLLALSILFMATSQNLSSSISNLGTMLFGTLFVGFLLSHVSLIRSLRDGRLWTLFLILTVWTGDIFAYLIGTFLGRHKLYPKISPKKTYEGLFGAIVGSIFAAMTFRLLYLPNLGTGLCLSLAIGIGTLGQAGDFTESMLKRSAQVKDSGSLIPGHGGMLDRLDSFLFSAPFLHYSLLCLLKETP